MLTNILSKIICDTYEQEFRRKQEPDKHIAMKIRFITYKDTGLELLLTWEGYVGVFFREINLTSGIKKAWHILSCHDSCWRSDGVDSFIFEHREDINCIIGLFNWYEKIELTEQENQELRKIEKAR
jgi:hypothetical protein